MTSDFWYGFLIWFIAMAIPASIIPLGFILSWDPQVSGRYGREHLRWFKRSVAFNVCGWAVNASLIMAGATYFSDLHAQRELSLRQDMTDRLTASLAQCTATVQGLETLANSAYERVVASEDALTKWYDQVNVR